MRLKRRTSADQRGEGRRIARLQFDREPRRRFAFDDRSGGNLGRTGGAREVNDDSGLAGGKQAEAKPLHKQNIGQRADPAGRRIELKIHLRHVDDNAIRRGQGGGARLHRSRQVEHQFGRVLVLRKPRADRNGRACLARPNRSEAASPSA